MDKIEHRFLNHIPMHSLSLRLARATIKMEHDQDWKIDKINPVHDLVVGLSGTGLYQIGDNATKIALGPGSAMLIPAYTRFRGMHNGLSIPFTGIAQHFSLELFGKGDFIQQMDLERVVKIPHWDVIEPMVSHYRNIAPHNTTNLAQHHLFMVILLAYLEEAFINWMTERKPNDAHDHLSVHIMLVASQLSADPVGSGVDVALSNIPYNQDYFRRAFKERMGYTPQKFRELKRMEFAANRLGMGLSVKTVAAELGFNDPYFFSRMFKRYLRASPSKYREKSNVDP